MLNDTLAKMPKTKAMKDAEAKAIVDAERKKKDAEAREAKEARLKVLVVTSIMILFDNTPGSDTRSTGIISNI